MTNDTAETESMTSMDGKDPKANDAAERIDIAPLEDLEDAARGVIDTIGRVSSRILWASLLAYGVAAAIGITVAFITPMRDPYLISAMYLVLFVYILSYIKAHQRLAYVRSIVTLVVAETLLAFWVYILVDRIPERPVFLSTGDAVARGEIVLRNELTMLWGSVFGLGCAAAGLLIHWTWLGRLKRVLT